MRLGFLGLVVKPGWLYSEPAPDILGGPDMTSRPDMPTAWLFNGYERPAPVANDARREMLPDTPCMTYLPTCDIGVVSGVNVGTVTPFNYVEAGPGKAFSDPYFIRIFWGGGRLSEVEELFDFQVPKRNSFKVFDSHQPRPGPAPSAQRLPATEGCPCC